MVPGFCSIELAQEVFALSSTTPHARTCSRRCSPCPAMTTVSLVWFTPGCDSEHGAHTCARTHTHLCGGANIFSFAERLNTMYEIEVLGFVKDKSGVGGVGVFDVCGQPFINAAMKGLSNSNKPSLHQT